MRRIKKLILAMICMCVITLGAGFCIGNVNAMDNTNARAIESYSRSTVIGLQTYGSVDVSVVIKHNMTTGKSWINSVSHTDHYNPTYLDLKTVSVSTNPAVNEYFTGSKRIKVTLKYRKSGSVITTNRYIQL